PFNIPVQRFAVYLEWYEAFGVSEELEANLRKEAARARDFIAFCDSCHLCDQQCPYGVPLSTFAQRAVEKLA
ncbi:MAG: hypothetical protein H5T69_11335, partial [Chloroflexi bacterium]|nr:hypothetical protein [Chloroflexota bacterium]